jgi:hypothetical protein
MKCQLTIAKLPFAPKSKGWGGRRVRLHQHAHPMIHEGKPWCATSPVVAFWPVNAIWCWSAAQARARRTWLSASPVPAFAAPPHAIRIAQAPRPPPHGASATGTPAPAPWRQRHGDPGPRPMAPAPRGPRPPPHGASATGTPGGARGRFFNVVDLVNKLDAEARASRPPHAAAGPIRGAAPPIISAASTPLLGDLGRPRRARLPALRPDRWPAALPPDQPALRAQLGHRHHQPDLRRVADRVRRRQNDHGPPRPADPSLRHRPDRQRKLALQKPRLIPPPKNRIAGEIVAPPTAPRRSPPRSLANAAEGSLLHADRGSRFHAD